MKKIILCCLTVVLIMKISALSAQISASSPHLFYQDPKLNIYVDKVLYTFPGSDYFFIHVTLTNNSPKVIGVDLSDNTRILYPNQWGIYSTPYRTEINERQIIPDPLDDSRCAILKEKFNTGKLTMIAAGQSYAYYTAYNGCKASALSLPEGQYFIFTIDGHLFYTDGSTYGQVKCNDNLVRREINMPWPLKWENLSSSTSVISR
jgi:hypothetical protein